MYSIKPGRGPSLFGAIFALIVGVPFVIFWITVASKSGAPGFLVFFGIAFLIVVLVSVFRGFYNATSKNRISEYDITTKDEESDPMDRLISGPSNSGSSSADVKEKRFCPFCGTEHDSEFRFCPKCGKAQPADNNRT
jgi:hypothetical protein